MYISNFSNANQRNLTFGYGIKKCLFGDPDHQYADYTTMLSCAEKIEREQGPEKLNEYLDAVKHFSQKRFDASAIVEEYWNQIKTCSESAKNKFINVLGDMRFEKTKTKSDMPWGDSDITKLDAFVYNGADEGCKNTKPMYTDLGIWYHIQDYIKPLGLLISEKPEELLGSAEGIKKLEKTIDKKMEENLRKQLEQVINNAANEKKKQTSQQRQTCIREQLSKMGVEPKK